MGISSDVFFENNKMHINHSHIANFVDMMLIQNN